MHERSIYDLLCQSMYAMHLEPGEVKQSCISACTVSIACTQYWHTASAQSKVIAHLQVGQVYECVHNRFCRRMLKDTDDSQNQ